MTATPRTDAALAQTLEICGRLGPEHRPLTECCRELEAEVARLQRIVDAADRFDTALSEALNSGDGVYRP